MFLFPVHIPAVPHNSVLADDPHSLVKVSHMFPEEPAALHHGGVLVKAAPELPHLVASYPSRSLAPHVADEQYGLGRISLGSQVIHAEHEHEGHIDGLHHGFPNVNPFKALVAVPDSV